MSNEVQQHPFLAPGLLIGLFVGFACQPDIPNYEGFFDDLEEELCGNGVIDYHSEECDEGKDNDSRGFCNQLCKKAKCGDGFVQLDEECDLGTENAVDGSCTLTCRNAQCGDGAVQPGEACDAGDENTDAPYGGGCSTTCQPVPICGDGHFDPGYEECDDANQHNVDACTNACTVATCGDGIVYIGHEACDDANDDNTDECLDTCELPYCGDGIVQPGEECDGEDNCNDVCFRDRYVFVSTWTFDGNIKSTSIYTGIEVADSACQSLSQMSGLKTDALFLAWLSDDETSPDQRFFHSKGRYILPDGTVIADNWDDLTDGDLDHPIDQTEDSSTPEANNVWSNTRADGKLESTVDTCEYWTSDSLDDRSRVGSTTRTDSGWTDRVENPVSCGFPFHVYCFEQGP